MKILVDKMPEVGQECPFFSDGNCACKGGEWRFHNECYQFRFDGSRYNSNYGDCHYLAPIKTTAKARWLRMNQYNGYCEKCGAMVGKDNYCSHCGAKFDLENSDE